MFGHVFKDLKAYSDTNSISLKPYIYKTCQLQHEPLGKKSNIDINFKDVIMFPILCGKLSNGKSK